MNLSTDYGLRCALYLAQAGKSATAEEIGEASGLERIHAQKILRQLKHKGLVKSASGAGGGFTLSRPPEKVTLYDLISAMEKTMCFNRCLEDDQFCSLDRAGFCPVHQIYIGMQAVIREYLSAHTLADVLTRP